MLLVLLVNAMQTLGSSPLRTTQPKLLMDRPLIILLCVNFCPSAKSSKIQRHVQKTHIATRVLVVQHVFVMMDTKMTATADVLVLIHAIRISVLLPIQPVVHQLMMPYVNVMWDLICLNSMVPFMSPAAVHISTIRTALSALASFHVCQILVIPTKIRYALQRLYWESIPHIANVIPVTKTSTIVITRLKQPILHHLTALMLMNVLIPTPTPA